jgi:hypothetical protein
MINNYKEHEVQENGINSKIITHKVVFFIGFKLFVITIFLV